MNTNSELAEIKRIVQENSDILHQHTDMLQRHGEILYQHTDMLQRHGEVLQHHSDLLLQLSKDLPARGVRSDHGTIGFARRAGKHCRKPTERS